jgi:uncharacterized protein YfaS (alpha-2-macroglobulin family)
VDYSTFVQLPEAGMVVENGGYRQLCVSGLEHGKRYTVTFREGLPAADGQVMAKSVEVTQYIRDRAPGVKFPGRGYVLPKSGEAALPVETVNTEKLDLTLYRVTDRNLLRSIQDYYFGAPINVYSEEYFADTVGERAVDRHGHRGAGGEQGRHHPPAAGRGAGPGFRRGSMR